MSNTTNASNVEADIIVTAQFSDDTTALQAARHLRAVGFSPDEISVLTVRGDSAERGSGERLSGGAAGAAIGGATGAALLAPLAAVGTFIAPGLSVFAAGPWLAALTGAGAGGAAGGLLGAVFGSEVPENETERYTQALEQGAVLLGVAVPPSEVARLIKVLRESGGTRVRAGDELIL